MTAQANRLGQHLNPNYITPHSSYIYQMDLDFTLFEENQLILQHGLQLTLMQAFQYIRITTGLSTGVHTAMRSAVL